MLYLVKTDFEKLIYNMSKYYEDISGTYWYTFTDSAKKRKLEVNIDIKYLWDLYLTQNKKCALSGLNLILDNFARKKKKLEDNEYYASLDRINNNFGYIDGNVRWIAREINYMKWKFSDKIFIDFCKNISKANDK